MPSERSLDEYSPSTTCRLSTSGSSGSVISPSLVVCSAFDAGPHASSSGAKKVSGPSASSSSASTLPTKVATVAWLPFLPRTPARLSANVGRPASGFAFHVPPDCVCLIALSPSAAPASAAAGVASGGCAASCFVPLIIPYCMSPRSNARCMRSSVTISLTVLYHMRGPLAMTNHGLHTPTQIECLQLSMVSFTQSSPATVSKAPVPCSRRSYSSTETK
mmetsp:Transcript_6620/g.23368  ORF Transcript_6620/g.23368 Transcript_6620/m.23368 type:complete len:219 (+) Transcript_6620:1498-2154(+)